MTRVMTADDHRFMARAIKLARRGLFTTHPNPRVGCVLVKDGRIVGEGYHQRAGQPHAERLAIAAAGDQARGATAYVTLEPCCHFGKTPPCTDGLLEAGVSRVIAAMQDPNPLVAGKGLKLLAEAGVETDCGLMEAEAQALNPGFVSRMTRGRPYVRCKLAMSLDGRTAMANGESQWITGPEARQDVQRLRARSDAIMTGIGTVLADDPSMNVRIESSATDGQPLPQPLRVVLDGNLNMPADARMLGLSGKTLVLCCSDDQARREALEQNGAEVEKIAGAGESVDLPAVMTSLASREVNELLIEAGPILAGSALSAGLIDELIIYTAPLIMGNAARGLFHLPELRRMGDAISLDIRDLRMVGRDIRIVLTAPR